MTKKTVGFIKVYIFPILPLLFLTGLTVSCKTNFNIQQEINNSSLKMQAQNIEQQINWTEELDGSILLKEIEMPSFISPYVESTVQSYSAASNSKISQCVYPELSGFALLDLSSYNYTELNFVKNFSQSVLELSINDSVMQKNKLFEIKLFLYELEKLLDKGITFSDYKLGEPVHGENIIQSPIRFISKDKRNFLDINIYLIYENDELKIQQIENLGLK